MATDKPYLRDVGKYIPAADCYRMTAIQKLTAGDGRVPDYCHGRCLHKAAKAVYKATLKDWDNWQQSYQKKNKKRLK